MIEVFIVTLLGVMASQASPGPNLVAVASVSLSRGRRAGLFTVAGISSGMLVWSLATAYGLAKLLETFPYSLTAMRFLGGGYLLWMAFKGLRAALANKPGRINPTGEELSGIRAWTKGLLVVLTNPKAAIMWVAVATFLFGAGLNAEEALLFGPLAAVSAFMIYGSYALLFSTGLAQRSYRKFARWMELFFAASFGALGGKLIFDGVKELGPGRYWEFSRDSLLRAVLEDKVIFGANGNAIPSIKKPASVEKSRLTRVFTWIDERELSHIRPICESLPFQITVYHLSYTTCSKWRGFVFFQPCQLFDKLHINTFCLKKIIKHSLILRG